MTLKSGHKTHPSPLSALPLSLSFVLFSNLLPSLDSLGSEQILSAFVSSQESNLTHS